MFCAIASLTACAWSAPPAEENERFFDPIAFFDGHTLSHGVVEDRSGAPSEEIATDSQASIDANNRLQMVQHLSFQDGTSQQRSWTVWHTGPHRYAATASDMIGTATGESHGRMFHWQWALARSPGNPLMNVTMEQWMYGLDDGSALIRTTVGKFGFILAEVTEHFSHPPTPPACVPPAAAPHA
jgi:hypothetical protein